MRRRRLASLRLLACAAMLLGAPAGAQAATDAEATAAAATVQQAIAVPSGWTGASATCTAGTESAASIDATLRAINAYRSVAGLAPVTLDPAAAPRALQAALMMRAGNDNGNRRGLSHAPDPTWPCYSAEGAGAAGASNLALGGSGAGAIQMYVDDTGVDSLGHRRWVLDPGAAAFGTGSTGSTNALVVIGLARTPVPSGTQVAWPPAGAVAPSWVPERWSLSLGGSGDGVTFTDPVVSMTLDGAPLTVSDVADLGTGYGTGRTLAWTPSLPAGALRSGYHQLAVTISGGAVNGVPAPIAYTTTVGTPAPPPTPTPVPTPQPAPAVPLAVLPGLRPRVVLPRGRVRIGTRLSATLVQGTGRIATQYQWLRGGVPIPGATAVRHRITRRDLGRTLRIRVTSQAKDGSGALTETSDGVKIRRR